MKKIIFFLTVALLSVSGVVNAQKFAWVDATTVFEEMPETKKAKDSLDRLQAQLDNELQRMQSSLQKLYADYEADEKAKLINDFNREDRVTEIKDYESRLQRKAQMNQSLLQERYQTLVNAIEEKIQNAIKAVAKANGITYVFTKEQVYVIGDGAVDITPLVRKQLGLPAPVPAGTPGTGTGTGTAPTK